MKKKFLALVMTLSMVLSLVPMTALATEGGQEDGETSPAGSTIYVDVNSVNEGNGSKDNPYKSLVTAVNRATSGDTIQLAEGTYTLYKEKADKEKADVLQKDLTFVGSGTDKTTWLIGPKVPNPAHFGTEYNSDYSFDVRGTEAKETVTFKNMTLQSGKADYLGFAGTDNTVVEGCVIEGRTSYWGYTSAKFINTTFKCPPGDYALWTYSSPEMTFDRCTFNSSGKVINVYTDYDAGKHDITVNFKNCTVNSTALESLSVMNINDSNMGSFKYVINFSGVNTVNGIKADGIESTDGSHASTAYNTENKKKTSAQATCSKLFEFNMKYGNGNSGKTIVNMDTKPVWKDGRMISHAIDTAHDKYTDGYKDNAFTTTEPDWTFNPQDGKMHRTVTKKCNYCGDEEVTQETKEPTPVEPDDPNAPVWQTSKSKKATKLNGNYESKVTLSLPSAEENLATDVVLVLDASKCTKDMLEATIKLLGNLEKQVELGANIKVGIVMFKGNAVPFRTLTKADDLKDLCGTFTGLIQENDTDGEKTKAAVRKYVAQTYSEFMNSGTNIPAGLALAKEMLAGDGDTSVTDARKYVVLVSDGNTYLFCHQTENGGYDYNTAYTRTGPGDYRSGISENNNWAPGNEIMLAFNEARNSGNWENYLNLVEENNNRFTQYDFKATAEVLEAPKGTPFLEGTPVIPTGVNNLVVNSDVSRYQTAQLYRELQNTYNCYYCFLPASGDYDTAATMMKQITPEKYLVDATDQGNIFSGITEDIVYLLGTGSTVKDEIGSGTDNKGNDYNFDFVDKAEAMTLTVGKTTYVTKKVEATAENETSRYLFVKEDVETANPEEAPYVLHYYQKGEDGKSNECFVWDINVPVSNFDPVALTYSVKLVNPKSASGTYGQYDEDGSKNYSGLYTNNSATLYPKDSNKNWGIPENFLKPTVSYTVSGGSGGNHKPTVTIPDDVPTGLNGKDHYAYVVGYPDGMVYPQKNITRAEVATIFFRLLEDETREANMTKSNSYNDMKDGAWYTCAVSTLSKMGIIKGYEDGSFKPDASISRAEFAAIAARFDPDGDKTPATFSDVSSHWAKDEISIAANHGWIKGYEDGSFKPDQKITRAETMTLVNRVLKRLPETKDDLHKDMKTWPDNQNESAWFYLAVQEATNSHYQNLKKDGTHEKWESMRETRDWAALEK